MKKQTTEIFENADCIVGYPARNVRADLFGIIRALANESDCAVLKDVVAAKVYYRGARRAMNGVNGLEDVRAITRIDFEMRDRIVKMISDNLKGKSPFRLSLGEYAALKWLTDTYCKLAEKTTMDELDWYGIRNKVNEIRPFFYLIPSAI